MNKFVIGSFITESNSFSPLKTNLDHFKKSGYLLVGNEIFDYHTAAVRNELSGFIDYCRSKNIDIIPTCAAWALPNGPLELGAYKYIKNEILSKIYDLNDINGVYLALHGSVLVEGIDDPEGDLLENTKKIIGEKPLFVSFDFHANVTQKMVMNSDIIVGYNSFPHNNMYETGQKAAILASTYYLKLKELRKIFIKIPMIAPLERMTTNDDEPVAKIIKEINNIEKDDGILSISFFGVHFWLDISDLGSSIVGIVDKEKVEYAQKRMSKIATEFWENRSFFYDLNLYSPDQAIKDALNLDISPILLNDSSDNVGAGATGDSTCVLKELLRMQIKEPTILSIVDPEAVLEAIKGGIGNDVELLVGGKINKSIYKPIKVIGKVRTIFDGKYRLRGPACHGLVANLGRTVVLEIYNSIFIQLTERPHFTIDPEHYRCVGLFPERMKFVVIKSQGSFKASYDKISKTVFYLDTPGASSSNIKKLPFVNINKKELYPFNNNISFIPKPLIYSV